MHIGELTKAKAALYVQLLRGITNLSDRDVELMDLLAMDPDIQAVLENARRQDKTNGNWNH